MIKTNRLVIKRLSNNDYSRIEYLLTNDIIKKTYMIPDFKERNELDKLFNKLLTNSLSDSHFVRGIYLNDLLIGFMNDCMIKNKEIELGYVIDPVYHSKGYMTEALIDVSDNLLQNGFDKIITGAFIENIASRRVMEKSGFILTDEEEDITYKGIIHHVVYYNKKEK